MKLVTKVPKDLPSRDPIHGTKCSSALNGAKKLVGIDDMGIPQAIELLKLW